MRTVSVVQHTEAEYLGLIEDHLEGRNIRFLYHRPFAAGGTLPPGAEGSDGLILLGGGPYGLVSGHLLPSAGPELRLTREYLDRGLPVIGFELGAVILAVAAGGGAREAPLRFDVERLETIGAGPLADALPRSFPMAHYLRDAPIPPEGAETVATGPDGSAGIFTVNGNCAGFLGHPGAKRGMVEDLVMEFAETPDGTVEALEKLGAAQAEVAEALAALMVGLIAQTGLMDR